MRHFLDAIQSSDIIKRVNARRQAAVETENLIVDQGGEGKVVEQVGKVLPHVSVAVLAQAFVVKAVDLGDLAGLVVAAENGDALRVSDLEGDEESDRLHGVVSSVDVITCKAGVSQYARLIHPPVGSSYP